MRPRTSRLQRNLWASGIAAVLLLGAGCERTKKNPGRTPVAFDGPQGDAPHTLRSDGRLHARPRAGTGSADARGLQPLGLGGKRDGFLYVPESYRPDAPARLVVALHGAGGNGRQGLGWLQKLADAKGFLLLLPESKGPSWDLIMGDYGQDVAFLDQALEHVFERYAVDPRGVVLAGFSDGASYALSLGILNGDLFRHIIAYSPGFVSAEDPRGSPRIFVTHGENDTVLSIARCSRKLVPALQAGGFDVRYEEFDGGHVVPAELVRASIDWLDAGH